MGLCVTKTHLDDSRTEFTSAEATHAEWREKGFNEFGILPKVKESKCESQSEHTASESEDDFQSCATDSSYGSEELPGGKICQTLQDLPTAVPTKTLRDVVEGEGASGFEAYLARKERKKKQKGSRSSGGKKKPAQDFLSGVPEVDTDIAFRYSFIVLGDMAAKAVDAACTSEAAQKLPHAANADLIVAPGEKSDKTPSVSSSTARRGPANANRCLCPVPFPFGRTDQKDRLTLAKLVFKHDPTWNKQSRQEPPVCNSPLEASTTCMVFVVVLDPEEAGLEPFSEQLNTLQQLLRVVRHRTLPEFRPVRALLMLRLKEAPVEDDAVEGWTSEIAEFEDSNGAIWKFGPVCMRNANDLHAAFATIASERLLKNQQGDAGAGNNSDMFEEEDLLPPMWGETEGDEADGVDFTFQSSSGSERSKTKTQRFVDTVGRFRRAASFGT
jgi:hypothetical protein